MIKVSKIVYKETLYVSLVILALSVIMQLAFFFFGNWNYTFITGNLLGAGTMQIRQASFHRVINMQRQPAFLGGCEEPPTSFSKPRGFYNYFHCLFLNRRLHNNAKRFSSNLPIFCKQ